MTDDLDAVVHETEAGADDDPGDERQQPARNPRGEPLDAEQQHERPRPHRQCHPVSVAEVPDEMHELVDRVA
ncbi:MAG: hypothetical protein WAL63_04160 [Solirubrobacteraceae bacterium]